MDAFDHGHEAGEASPVVESCTLETELKNQALPFLYKFKVDEGIKTRESNFMSFKNVFKVRQEIEHVLSGHVVDDKEAADGGHDGGMVDESKETLEEVEHNFFYFYPVIRKIKIDLFTGRKQTDSTEYLSKLQTKDGSQFNQMNGLLLADLIDRQQSNAEFFDCCAIQKLIDMQFKSTYKILMNLTRLYFVGFIVPFVISLFLKHPEGEPEPENRLSTRMFKWKIGLLSVAFVTQIFFFGIEYAEISYTSFYQWISEFWNFVDGTFLFFFIVHNI